MIDSEKAFGRQLWGVLSLELWYQKLINKRQLNTDTIQLANSNKVESLISLAMNHKALYYPKCFSIHPRN